jgi:hypothetical protein
LSGSNVITTGPDGDLYLHGGTDNDQDFLAHARQDKPLLLEKIGFLSKLINELKS